MSRGDFPENCTTSGELVLAFDKMTNHLSDMAPRGTFIMGPRFFITETTLNTGKTACLSPDDSYHVFKVLRLQTGDIVEVSDGKGDCYIAEVTFSDKKSVSVLLKEPLTEKSEPPVKITLLQGLLKGRKMDLVVRQAVELGVTRIMPLMTSRSIPVFKDGDHGGGKSGRWQKIARAAAAQCRRSIIPTVEVPLLLKEANFKNIFKEELLLVFWEEEKDKPIPFANINKEMQKASGISVFVGPEGGFDHTETELLRQKGALVAGLGPRILRADTASVAAVTLIQYGLGDLQGESI